MERLPSLLVLLVALLASGCAQNPVTGESDFVLMSEAEEIALGRRTSAEVQEQYRTYDDPALQAYVQAVGERVAARSHRPELIYRFTVLDSEEVNAFALPGGYIYITRGLLAYLNTEAELAAVLGHEIGHVTARHSVRQYSAAQATNLGLVLGQILVPEMRGTGASNLLGALGTALVRGYGRDHELEADRLGAEYLARTGYDPQAMIGVIRVLKNQELFESERARREGREPKVYHGVFSTHPDNDTRLRQAVASVGGARGPATDRHQPRPYLEVIEGLAFGPSAAEGVLRGNAFYHEGLDFGLRLPEGWRVENRPDRLLAIPPSNDALLQLTVEDLNKRIGPEAFIRERLGRPQLARGQPLSAGDLPGYTGLTAMQTPFGSRTTRLTVVHHGTRAFIFAGAAERDGARTRFDPHFLDTALSLHPLSAEERALARTLRIALVTAAPGTRYADLAARSRLTNYAEQQLRLLNDDYPDGEPDPGARIKIVE